MSIQKFKLETLSKLDDGRIREAFEQAIAHCIDDCRDRPALPKSRKVALNVTVEPLPSESGELESCNVTFQIASTVPKRESKTYNMKASQSGLLFNKMSPEDVRQTTIDEATKPKRVKNAS